VCKDRVCGGGGAAWMDLALARALDVCCGSGDPAVLLADAVGPAGRVTGLDFAADMLQVGGCMFQREHACV
jgi:ubiquinone/menaquinone biosynthesis C-methylase UbiE